MGVNTSNVVNTNVTNSILPELQPSPSIRSPPAFASEANVTIEQALIGNSALRISYIWTKATNLELNDSYNSSPSSYQWQMATGTAAPTGGASVIGTPQQNTYAATAEGPYDQTTWGANNMRERTGWSNYNALQVSYHAPLPSRHCLPDLLCVCKGYAGGRVANHLPGCELSRRVGLRGDNDVSVRNHRLPRRSSAVSPRGREGLAGLA